ncbi:response regulator transcription factor [Rurimicrobium arvi]|uniref:Response regulator transcription factor n=1 Tax=Rurimicrobium arvi TaxID=2049916 RepID=A0ABP8MPB9_9BACT
MIRIAIVDDHKLFRKGMINLIELVSPDFTIVFEADNGLELMRSIAQCTELPHIILMDVNMPEMDGFATVQWLTEQYPDIRILVVSMLQSEESIIRMLRLGVKGYLGKDVEPSELATAIKAVYEKGYYYTDTVTGQLIHAIKTDSMRPGGRSHTLHQLNERELAFVRLACTELTYQEIADKMFLSPKTIDGYRKALFEKLQVKTRVALALWAVRNGVCQL